MLLGWSLWPEWFWLPPGIGWRHLQRDPARPDMFKARLSDLWVSFACGAAILLARRLLEWLVLRPLGHRWKLADPDFVPRTKEDQRLEVAYQSSLSNGGPDCAALSKTIDRSETFVSNWFRRRRNQQKTKQLTKFTEGCWQLMFYSCSFAYGAATLWRKPFAWDTRLIWRGWPEHHVTGDIYWYYMVELGFYWCALATVCSDTKRKDFREMVLHHVVTIVLMVFSWALNFTRIGAMVLVLHDAADPLLNLAKLGSYTKVQWVSDPAFALLLLIWLATRLVVYPFCIVYTSLFELDAECGTCPALKILQGFLLVLQVLHVIWTYFILKVALRVAFCGNRQDSRSDSEESGSERVGQKLKRR